MEKIYVSESERKLLELMAQRGVEKGRVYTSDELARLLGVDKSTVESVARLLASRGLVEVREEVVEGYELTDEAKRYLEEGFPEERLVKLLAEMGGRAPVEVVKERLGPEASIALTNALRKKWVRVDQGVVELTVDPSRAEAWERAALRALERGEQLPGDKARLLRRRRLVRPRRRRVTLVKVLEDPARLLERTGVEVGSLTRDMIETGAWRRVKLRAYDVKALPPRRYPGRLHFFAEFVEHIRDVMKELGFVEVEAPPVELEFWNYDVLFQPQFHPARSPSDTFYLAEPREAPIPEALGKRVAEAHERGLAGSEGWRYSWDPRRAMRLVLRSHTTAVSARVLASRPAPPFRFFSLGRVYRVENVDARHLPEFHQVDGIACEEGVNVRWLLGMLGEILERLGLYEYKFRPAYFPFTEPSIEGYVKVGSTWLEVFGAGLFRPEMLAALGVEEPVAAWGMGIERLAMALYGLGDIRMLYSTDVGFLESLPTRWWIYAGSEV